VSVHPAGNGCCEVTVYYRPASVWEDRTVWLQYAADGAPPLRLAPHRPQFGPWDPGELAWDQFLTPDPPGLVSFGVQIANNAGVPLPLARVAACVIVR
jgi:hypothetical protein